MREVIDWDKWGEGGSLNEMKEKQSNEKCFSSGFSTFQSVSPNNLPNVSTSIWDNEKCRVREVEKLRHVLACSAIRNDDKCIAESNDATV